nr:titin isoform X1 [Helicoverpa armigera]
MLFYIYLVILCSKFISIMSTENTSLPVKIIAGKPCSLQSNYKFTDGSNITIILQFSNEKHFINYGWLRLRSEEDKVLIKETLKVNSSIVVNKTMAGTWEFEFYYYPNMSEFQPEKAKIPHYGTNYSSSECRTVVEIVNATKPENLSSAGRSLPSDDKYMIIGAVAGVSVLIILAQTAYIAVLKAKARSLNAHKHISKITPETDEHETARYCANPVPKALKIAAPRDDDDDDEAIYEAPNIDLNGRIGLQVPQPPAVNTIPRTPRTDHKNRVGPPTMLPPGLKENQQPTFPRGRSNDREANLANRPPLPLPNQPQEVYEEMESEDVYEPPPVNPPQPMPPRLPKPPKKVPTGKLLDVKENTLKLKPVNKPPVTPKPGRPRSIVNSPGNELEQVLKRRNNAVEQHTGPKTNELEQALRRRNNDIQNSELEAAMRRRNNVAPVPVTTIPEPSRLKPSSRPPPRSRTAEQSKPRSPPVPQPMQEEIYFNENRDSSDEEWNYEPLKPYTNYDPNIYNI